MGDIKITIGYRYLAGGAAANPTCRLIVTKNPVANSVECKCEVCGEVDTYKVSMLKKQEVIACKKCKGNIDIGKVYNEHLVIAGYTIRDKKFMFMVKCNTCGKTFIITKEQLEERKFKCIVCSGNKDNINNKVFDKKEQNKEIISLLINNSYFKFIKGNVTTINEYSLIVDGQEIAFRKLVFATGSYFFQPENYPNLKREMYLNLDEVSKIDQFYENVAIYGTDVNALELAYAFALLGSNVYIFDENVNPFNNFDDDFESILKTDFMIDKIN